MLIFSMSIYTDFHLKRFFRSPYLQISEANLFDMYVLCEK